MSAMQDRIVIVTGAGRGLGRDHALFLAASGSKVVVNDLGGGRDGTGQQTPSPADEVVAEIIAAGGEAVANYDDVADEKGATNLVQTAIQTFGGLDALVNNAGILRDKVLVNLGAADWDLVLSVNLRGTYLPLREAARFWRQQTKVGDQVAGRVVNTSSESGVFANAGQANYAAAKAGVAALTQVAAKELTRYGVRVNAILPRARTRLTEDILGPDSVPKPGEFDWWEPANVSPFVGYLCTDQVDFTGEVFVVGGSTVQRARPWELDGEWILTGDGRWTIETLADAVAVAGSPGGRGPSGLSWPQQQD
jgi:NAD(P)-dependent dehydrogenase (short-subunit alcohol dehydrogenase family)